MFSFFSNLIALSFYDAFYLKFLFGGSCGGYIRNMVTINQYFFYSCIIPFKWIVSFSSSSSSSFNTSTLRLIILMTFKQTTLSLFPIQVSSNLSAINYLNCRTDIRLKIGENFKRNYRLFPQKSIEFSLSLSLSHQQKSFLFPLIFALPLNPFSSSVFFLDSLD